MKQFSSFPPFVCLFVKLVVFSIAWLLIGSMHAFSDVAEYPKNGERILSFDSEITINKDASLLVVERIKVVAKGKEIRRGIYREFPIRYQNKFGANVFVEFDVVSIERDGKPENYHIEKALDSITIYLGSQDHYLDPGEYNYQIIYRTSRQFFYFDEFDELYWNVSGNDWNFALEKVTATITLPAAVPENKLTIYGYTGYRGSDERNYRHTLLNDQQVYFETTEILEAQEGLTVRLQFPKGLIDQPSINDKLRYFLQDNTQAAICLTGMLAVLFYYLLVWRRVGKDPARDIIIPLYQAPTNLSAAATRFIFRGRGRYDNKVFTTAILSLTVKGYVKIEEDKQGYRLVKTGSSHKVLTNDEQAVLDELKFSKVNGQKVFELDSKNCQYLKNSALALAKCLKSNHLKNCFLDNRRFLARGVMGSFLVLVILAPFGSLDQFGVLLFSVPFLGAGIWLLFLIGRTWRKVVTTKSQRASAIMTAVVTTLFSMPVFLIGSIALQALASVISPLMVIGLVGLYIINIGFSYLLKAPTIFGSQLLEQIEGFKMYLGTAEEDRISAIKAPHKTPELFESLLPFAFALDLENTWAEKFSELLSRAKADAAAYEPTWYSGDSWRTGGATGFTDSLSDRFSSTITSSSISPSSASSSSSSSSWSSSGGGSSGSSGGGRGGGGGGGW